ncbi:MAG TPA: ATP-binding protein [Candidatus Nanoarchaeia archaeon]|nr:ATP-binding protein [Candidatus Nanoarchaeia archaeon]
MDLRELRIQNIWWDRDINLDFHLRRLAENKYIFRPKIIPIEELLREKSGIYTLIGPRQIGKTTYLKQIIRELLSHYPKNNLFYFSCENITPEKLKEAILFFMNNIAEKGKLFIFLDEVSLVERWELVELELYNKGLLEQTIIINSGSSSVNLKKSSEKLPGRKGKGRLYYFFPLSFREYVFLVEPKAEEMDKKPLMHLDSLKKLFYKYILAGGFPQIINEQATGSIDDSKYDIYRDWIEGEITKFGRSVNYAYQILSRVMESRTSQTNWESIAKNSTIKSHTTVSDYIDLLDSLFITKTVNSISSDLKIGVAKNKKVYFFDHFLLSVVEKSLLKINDYYDYYTDKLTDETYLSKIVENIVFSNLIKHIVNRGYSINNTLFYWRSKTQQEIDFIVYVRKKSTKIIVPLEVKYSNNVSRSSIQTFKPIILSKDYYNDEHKIFPCHLVLFQLDKFVKV